MSLREGVELARPSQVDDAAGAQHREQKRWRHRALAGLSAREVRDGRFFNVNTEPIPVLDELGDTVELHNGKPHLEAVTVERARERSRHHPADADGFQRLDRDRTARRAAEVVPGTDDVTGLDVERELGVQGFEHVLADGIQPTNERMGRHDRIRGNVVAKFPRPAFENERLGHRDREYNTAVQPLRDAVIPWRPFGAVRLSTLQLRVCALAFVIGFAGCHAADDITPSPERSFRLGVIPGAQDFIVYVMESRGLLRERNLEPEKVEMLSPVNLHLMLAEQEVDVGFGGFTTMAIARAQGKPVIAVHGIFSPVNLVFVPKDSPLQSLSDLKGKKLGIFGGPSSTTFTFLRVIAQKWFDLDLVESVEVVSAPGPALSRLLDRGDVDAALFGTTESLKFGTEDRYRVLVDLSGEYRSRRGRAPAHVTVTTNEDFAAAHAELITDFLGAYREAVAYVKENPEIWSEYGERINMTGEREIEILRQKMTANLVGDWDRERIETQKEYLELAFDELGDSVSGPVPEGFLRDDFNP